jgi:mitochondrial fission protein ELM1
MTQSDPSDIPTSCWVVSDGRRGIENQALGLAEAVQSEWQAGEFEIHRAIARKDGYVTLPDARPPDLWIGCGRAAIPVARKHRTIFPNAFFTYVQDPRGRYRDFDLIIAPSHDELVRTNAISMIGSPNRISQAQLDTALDQFAPQLTALTQPRAAILIGGHSKRFKLSPEICDYLIDRLQTLLGNGISLMVTISRRTPDKARDRIKAAIAEHDQVWFHDGDGDNPYFAFLAAADWIFATEESTNMLVEAATVGKPLYALPMLGGPGKFARLHAALEGRNAMRPWLGRVERWTYPPLDETRRVARLLIKRWIGQIAARDNAEVTT